MAESLYNNIHDNTRKEGAVPKLMVYMVSIIQVKEKNAERTWVCYDEVYCQQVAACHSITWSRVNSSLFPLCFTGKAQSSSHCDLCLSSSHSTRECIWAGEGEQDAPAHLQAMEASVDALRQDIDSWEEVMDSNQRMGSHCILFYQSSC